MSVSRRGFLRSGAALWLASIPRRSAAAAYRVGVGREADAYAATRRAMLASGEFPDVWGRMVVVKPNLMMPAGSDTGATTDPEVTRAVVDRALAGGAASVVITETSPVGAHFAPTGHDAFATYHPRVRLLDVATRPVVLATVPGGLAYNAILVPDLYARRDIVFISVGKLKVHEHAVATLTVKNLFGVPAVDRYISFPSFARFAMHDRDLGGTILDLSRLRPVHYAVIDGVIGMEGAGPAFGSPVRMDLVLAGRNAVAVDRVGLAAMSLPQNAVRYLAYASRFGMGPEDLSSVELTGDTLEPRAFALPLFSPGIEYPRILPATFRPRDGQRAAIVQWYGESCRRRIQVVRLYDEDPRMDLVRTILAEGPVAAGTEWTAWDGRDNAGALVSPGRYAVHVRAYSTRGEIRPANAVTWVTVSE